MTWHYLGEGREYGDPRVWIYTVEDAERDRRKWEESRAIHMELAGIVIEQPPTDYDHRKELELNGQRRFPI
jgi:hypothetical protein